MDDDDQAAFQSYLDAAPYACESPEEMLSKLEQIISKMHVCIKARNWLVLSTWDGLLECWLLMRYPLSKSIRAKLVHLYYELILLPGIDARTCRNWVHMFNRLPWQPLWRIVKKELWPSGRKRSDLGGRNMLNLLLFTAGACQDMLAVFVPLITRSTMVGMFPVLVSFVPPTHIHLYLPTLLAFSKGFNSTIIDERILELAGELSEEHVSGAAGSAGEEGGAKPTWNFLVGKGLTSMDVPVGSNRNASTTASHADNQHKWALRIKKTISRQQSLAKMLVYSMAVDGPARDTSTATPRTSDGKLMQPTGFVAGSKALDTLDRLITSTETFFHPSNSGPYTISLTSFLQYLSAFFCQRMREEEQGSCVTPAAQRLTPAIRRAFVTILRTPALLAMFSKDPMSMGCAQATLRALAMLEPALVMPELLDRAYSGLEVVNETHRTTAVLTMLNAISRTLVTEKLWFGGQKHLVPLLELSIPGIDLNDPVKTSCATTFIVAAIQHVRIGDLSTHTSGLPAFDDEMMDVDGTDGTPFPSGTELGDVPAFGKDEERALVRDSTASFADWVTSLFRRVLALYENLPEEGGRKNTTGGKQEETVLSAIKSMIDIVCLHLSDHLFELVLRLVYEYGTTNAKSNAVRAFGQLVGCLARVRPEETLAKFLPFCIAQVEEELKHGASSVRTTSQNAAVPSDTTLHWNMAILRGCLGYGGAAVLKHREQVLGLLSLLVDKTRGERGYSGTGRLLGRVLHNVAGVYPINSRFVNTKEWFDPAFEKDHNAQWGKFYEAQDVVVEWHVPSAEEITFVIDILDRIGKPALDKVEELLATTTKWDGADRNDFCRYLHACRSIWSGLPTIYQEQRKDVPEPLIREDVEIADLVVTHLDVRAGFSLTDPADPRYQKVVAHRLRFGDVVQRAASALRQNTGGEDHIDAVMGVVRSIDVYLLSYAMTRGAIDALHKNYTQARDTNRIWSQQKDNSRLVFIKRAQVFHCNRLYMHGLYRHRSALDDKLIEELIELSLSPYTRIRRQAQSIFHNVSGYYLRSTRYVIPTLLGALSKGSDPDRMKGALYVLGNKGIMAYTLADLVYQEELFTTLLECQHEEKPSIQKLASSVASDCAAHMREEWAHTESYSLDVVRLDDALVSLETEFSSSFVDQKLVDEATAKSLVRAARRSERYTIMMTSILEIALRPKTHWRYVQMALRFLSALLRRDVPAVPGVAQFLLEHSISPQPTIRTSAQLAIVRLTSFIKMRTYSKSSEELWLDEWSHPLEKVVHVKDPSAFLKSLESPVDDTEQAAYVDKINTGFLLWAPSVKGYKRTKGDTSAVSWESPSQPSLRAISELMLKDEYFQKLATLWSQETGKSGNVDLRGDNVAYIKTLAKMFEHEVLDDIFRTIDPLLSDSDKFKQRAGADVSKGSKHWPKLLWEKLWTWSISRLDAVFPQIKPDTFPFWQSAVSAQIQDRDPRRNQPLIDWILALPLDFTGDSAFAMSKSLYMFGLVADGLGVRFASRADKAVSLLFDNANNGYNEIRAHVSAYLHIIIRDQWSPTYVSLEALLSACQDSPDPLSLRVTKHSGRLNEILSRLPKLKEERLPPPRVSQSEYDKIGLTILQWIWISAYSSHAALIFPYAVPMMPELLRMSELNDSSDLQVYSSAVLYVLSAVAVPDVYVPEILENFVSAIKSSTSWRIRLHALPALVVFFYRNLFSISAEGVTKVMGVLLDCLADENVEVRSMTSKVLSGVVRCSQRQSIVPLKNRFLALARKTTLPGRRDPTYAESLRSLHSAILGLCALIESFPYSVEPWMPALTDEFAGPLTDSRLLAFQTHQVRIIPSDTWHKDQLLFDEDQLQSLSTMLVGTSYCIFFLHLSEKRTGS
ncbi:armadillo-type protein [Mycena galericulata]|nr:armadillo-type protein [Mycena galericulata]